MNRKGMIIIDMPTTCFECKFCQEFGIGSKKYAYCYVTNGDTENDMKLIKYVYGYRQGKPDWCPLIEIKHSDGFSNLMDEL